MLSSEVLETCSPWVILQVWRNYAWYLIGRGHASKHEIAQLNQIASIYGRQSGRSVVLSGR